MRIVVFVFAACGAAMLPFSAICDDSTAALGAGGIEFTKAPQIRMAVEDLHISPDAVRIRYEFVNDGDKDIDALVAFPLPDIDTWEFYESPIGETTGDPVNFVGFKAIADGKPVPVRVEQRAIYHGRDVTGLVQSAGVPVNVILNQNFRKLDSLPAEKKKLLERGGIAEADAPDQEHPKWIVRTRFYWTQHFPAHKTVVLEHSYKPVTGQAFFGETEASAKAGSADDSWKKKYCMDDATVAKLKTMTAAAKRHPDRNSGMLEAYSTDFILKTANNWKGGIGNFHLAIDKLKTGNALSLCWAGALKKTGPTTFEFAAQNFHPAVDLALVVLE
jgi:hypothetical protein